MRTYSVRDIVDEGLDRRLVVNLVLHALPGSTGPASLWASSVRIGYRILVIGPRRTVTESGEIEFAPLDTEHILLAGDETAGLAIARILADLPSDARGHAFLEVPLTADINQLSAPGEALTTEGGSPGLYARIVGESGVVTTLRRLLVSEIGLDRAQVASMGDWRLGVAMRA